MHLLLMADSNIWYIWPKTSAFDILQIFIFILFFLLVLFIGRLIYLKKKETNSSWTHILNYAYSRKLTSKEISVLEHFFDTPKFSVMEKASLLDDKNAFQISLYSYLKKYHSDSVELYVKILDKLFPSENNLEIKSLADIQIGEVCAVEFDGVYFLAKVMNKSENEILLSINDSALKKDKEKSNVNLFFYRVNIGGFSIAGLIKKVNANGILFLQEGEFQAKGEEHLIAELIREVVIAPWGLKTKDSSLALHDPSLEIMNQQTNSKDEENSIESESPKAIESLFATTLKISDRAILLNIKDFFLNEEFLKSVDIWEMHLDLTTSNETIILKGKILKSSLFLDSFIFKFIAPSESDRRCIFEEIKKHSPERGFIS